MSETIGNWNVVETQRSTFSRIFMLTPIEKIPVEYLSFERRKGRYIDASYDAEIVSGRISHGWNEKRQEWHSAGSVSLRLLNPRTGEPYQSGWRAGTVRIDTFGARGAEMRPEIHTFLDTLIEATRPNTKITIIEEPLNV